MTATARQINARNEAFGSTPHYIRFIHWTHEAQLGQIFRKGAARHRAACSNENQSAKGGIAATLWAGRSLTKWIRRITLEWQVGIIVLRKVWQGDSAVL